MSIGGLKKDVLDDNEPDQLADDMEYRMADNGAAQTVLPVQPAEDQAEAAVEEETAEQDQGSDLSYFVIDWCLF